MMKDVSTPSRSSGYAICKSLMERQRLLCVGRQAKRRHCARKSMAIRMTVAQSRGRIPVIAGAGANATAHAITLAKDAEAAGADAILSVVPYYNKPTQEGLYAHFRAIAEATSLPVIL
jgi:hypothetical protein